MNGVDETGALALVGPGRAGTTIAAALQDQGWRIVGVAGRSPESPSTRAAAVRFGAPAVTVEAVATDAGLVIVATPDAVIESVATVLASSVRPGALVIHLSGARGLDALSAIPERIGALHPLQTLPSTEVGRERLSGSWCAISGDPQVATLAESINLRPIELDDADRARYHAAACIASNHLVGLLDQVAAVAPIPFEAYLPLVWATVENVATLGPQAALTGPVARGDVETVRCHLEVLEPSERGVYRALARRAHQLGGRSDPALDAVLR